MGASSASDSCGSCWGSAQTQRLGQVTTVRSGTARRAPTHVPTESFLKLRWVGSFQVGYDEGTVMFKIGREEPVASMDTSGKIVWARHNEIQTVNVRSVGADDLVDGERLPLAVKDLGSCDLYPQVKHRVDTRLVNVGVTEQVFRPRHRRQARKHESTKSKVFVVRKSEKFLLTS